MEISPFIKLIAAIIVGALISIPILLKVFGSKSTEELVEKDRSKEQRSAGSKRRETTSTRSVDHVTEYHISSGRKK